MRKTGRRAAWIAGIAVLALVALAMWLRPVAPVATGHAAKITCSGALLADRDVASASADLPSSPLRPFLRTRVDTDADRVTTSLLGFWDTSAWYTPGVGCTLAEEDPGFDPLVPASPLSADQAWPLGTSVDVAAARLDTSIDGEELDEAVQSAFDEDNPDGTKNTRAVVVAHQGRLVAEQYAAGFDADTPLLGWSMGKSLANAIVGRLVRMGELRPDQADLRPEWRDDLRSSITVTDLLQMRSGLAFDEADAIGADATTMLFRPGSTADFAAGKPLEANPGTWWKDSSGTSNILCDVAARAGGYGPEMARALVFDEIGMDSAVLEADASGGLVCSSFPYATARDWARFGQLYLDNGAWDGEQLFTEEWVGLTTTPVDLETEHPYGAHFWLNAGPAGELRMPDVPVDAYWASGNEGQHVVVIPSADLVVVRLGSTSDFSDIDWGLEDLLTGVLESLQVEGDVQEGTGDTGEVVSASDTPSPTPTDDG